MAEVRVRNVGQVQGHPRPCARCNDHEASEILDRYRDTPPHKRGSVKDVKNYRPLSVLVNDSVYFEKVVDPQFDVWISNFVPHKQFGFVKSTEAGDYGATLAVTIQQ